MQTSTLLKQGARNLAVANASRYFQVSAVGQESSSSPTEAVKSTVKGAAKTVDRAAADTLIKGIELGEKVRDVTKDAVGAASEKTSELRGQAKGKAHEVAGEAKGKAKEVEGEAKRKANEI